MTLYNMATAFCVVAVAAMLVYSAVAFRTIPPPRETANFPGHDYEGRISDGIKASPGLTTKEFK